MLRPLGARAKKFRKIKFKNLTKFENYDIILIEKRKEIKLMKIFVAPNYPDSRFYYDVLRFLLEHASRKEIDGYLDELCRK
jgi:hypothetical protein